MGFGGSGYQVFLGSFKGLAGQIGALFARTRMIAIQINRGDHSGFPVASSKDYPDMLTIRRIGLNCPGWAGLVIRFGFFRVQVAVCQCLTYFRQTDFPAIHPALAVPGNHQWPGSQKFQQGNGLLLIRTCLLLTQPDSTKIENGQYGQETQLTGKLASVKDGRRGGHSLGKRGSRFGIG
jgi:hypothetical protein